MSYLNDPEYQKLSLKEKLQWAKRDAEINKIPQADRMNRLIFSLLNRPIQLQCHVQIYVSVLGSNDWITAFLKDLDIVCILICGIFVKNCLDVYTNS